MTTKKEEKQVVNQNPRNFVYTQGTKIEVDGFLLTDLIAVFDKLMNEEIKPESRFKYNYVNEKGKIVKSPKVEDLETGKVKKILDIQRTIVNPTIEYSITEKGLAYAELKNFLETIHFENIQKGIAVNYQELTQSMINTEESSVEEG
jgi:hypothetical protein